MTHSRAWKTRTLLVVPIVLLACGDAVRVRTKPVQVQAKANPPPASLPPVEPPPAPVVEAPPSREPFVQLALGLNHSCGLRSDGFVACWGSNERGQLGDGTLRDRPAPTQVKGLRGIVAIGSVFDRTCAIANDGARWCWGQETSVNDVLDVPMQAQGPGQPWDEISMSGGVALVRNAQGEAGIATYPRKVGASARSPILRYTGLPKLEAIAGGKMPCGISTDRQVVCWTLISDDARRAWMSGAVSSMQAEAVPVPGISGALDLSRDCAITDKGEVACWDYTTFETPEPARVVPGFAQAAKLSRYFNDHLCVVRIDGSVMCKGGEVPPQREYLPSKKPGVIEGLSNVKQVVAGNTHACALDQEGKAFCWGFGEHGQLGDGITLDRNTPQVIEAFRGAKSIALGLERTCAVLGDGSVRCTGDNTAGALGNGSKTHRRSTSAVPFGTIKGAIAVATESNETCALLRDGTVWCAGLDNPNGTSRETVSVNKPRPVAGVRGIEQVVIKTAFYVVGRKKDGTVLRWGGTGRVDRPVKVPGLDGAKSIASVDIGGASLTCALKTNGTIGCEDRNVNYRANVSGTWKDVEALIAVRTALCARRAGIAGFTCWTVKYDTSYRVFVEMPLPEGELPSGPSTLEPSKATWPGGMSRVVHLAVGAGFGCALLDQGSVWCWGDNSKGQLGDDSAYKSRAEPAEVKGLEDVVQLEVGAAHACARRKDDTVLCWGHGRLGQLGLGGETFHSKPVAVVF